MNGGNQRTGESAVNTVTGSLSAVNVKLLGMTSCWRVSAYLARRRRIVVSRVSSP